MEPLAWTCALAGLLLGCGAALVPGFPGSAVALLGVVAFAGLTDFEIVTAEVLVLAVCVAAVGVFGQLAGPVIASRAAGGTAGAATGAALGAAAGSLVPVPGAAWVGAMLCGALLGVAGYREGLRRWLRGVVGTAGGCVVGGLIDLMSVLGVGAVLAIADFVHRLGAA